MTAERRKAAPAMVIEVFLAHDQAVVRDGIRLLVNREPDMQVVGTAATGREAVRLISKLRPHVVIMDMALAELNGIDATEQVHRRCPSTKVIILSLSSHVLYVVRALRAGASGYLTKECDGSELISAVRTVYRGGGHVCESMAERILDSWLFKGGLSLTGDPLSVLSAREREVLALVLDGRTNKEIGDSLGLSEKTAHTYRTRIMRKLSVEDLPGLVKFCIESGTITLRGSGP
jgi:DNA-binding NarL/FixJ family response regulator